MHSLHRRFEASARQADRSALGGAVTCHQAWLTYVPSSPDPGAF